MSKFNLPSMELNEIQNHDDFRVVFPNELTHFVDYLEKFNSFETCERYIKRFQSERIILLVLVNSIGYLSYFHDFHQIQSIYVLERDHQNMQHYQQKQQKYSKLVNVFTDECLLIEQLRRDILLTYRNDLPITISCLDEITTEQSLLSLNKNTFILIWNQLFIYFLVNSSNVDMNKLKKDMIEQCHLEYHNNQVQLNYINDFDQECTMDNVLEWYTADKFVYRLVNKAFRKRNIDLICKFRYFIILLYNKLKDLSMEQQGKTSTTVYRGQIMGRNDLENLQSNVGHLISTNSMLSTSRDQNVARKFITGAEIGVIFEISAINANNNILHPFADISRFSSMPDEEEILFFAGALFRIISVDKENDSTWIIKLILSNETVGQLEEIMNGVTEQLNFTTRWEHLFTKIDDLFLFRKYYKILTQNPLSWKDFMENVIGINIHHLISILGDHRKVIDYYKDLFWNERFIDHPKTIVLNIIIGYNYYHLLEYDDALFHYDIVLSSLNENHKLIGKLYVHIADLWRAKHDFQVALSYYEKALRILNNHHISGCDAARIYRKLSDIHHKQNNCEIATICEKEADQIDEHYRERSELDFERSLKYFQNQLNTHIDLPPLQHADALYSMGLCLMKINDYSQALEKFLQAKELYENNLRSYDHFIPTFCTLFDSIALVYLLLKDNFNALIMLKRSIHIRSTFNLN